MINRGAEAAEHGAEEDEPVIVRNSQQGNADAAEDRPERDEPGLGYLVGIIAENGLGNRG